jgi:ABC-2 type transport system ATP-binding protein
MISVKNLSKSYGNFLAVDNISFDVGKGEIVGFLGPNGAGKSTTMKIITCYIAPTMGNCNISDYNIYENSIEIRKLIGYLPETNPLYFEMDVKSYLNFVAEARNIPKLNRKSSVSRVVEECGLEKVYNKVIGTLSKGFKQRVGFAQAIIHDPQILILDEPTSGLDPVQIIEIRDLIKKLGKEKTIMLSTHIMQEVEATCNRVIIINNGKIITDDNVLNVKSAFKGGEIISLNIKNFNSDVSKIKNNIPGISDIEIIAEEGGFKQLRIKSNEKNTELTEKLFNFAVQEKAVLTELHRETVSLESVFLNLTSTKN